ncbi:hypothetical protein BaRGS_00010863 [Batillaria attramentaria]|uniref:Cleavage stimulation factor 50 kDa subunit n=1 Tax=Batillaria attramentaria TaxID=370345 RepID=A0ABD0LFA0_9CAEN
MENMEVKHRELLYRLMISQLFYDGHKEMAVALANVIKPHPACPPSDRLFNVFKMGLKVEDEKTENNDMTNNFVAPGSGIDLEFETEVQSISAEAALYETCYVTAHKLPCRCARFHPTGQIIATGSEDCSIKILDVERMLAKSATPVEIIAMETPQQQMENHPVIRTLYDHAAEVTCLDFHPYEQILASGSKDFSIRFFEYSKPSVKKAYKSIQEAAPLSYRHTTSNMTRNRCQLESKWKHLLSSKCTTTFKMAHQGQEVCSAVFSRNAKYVLSSGKDSLVKLWELSTNRCLIVYTGAGATGKMEHRTNAIFNHTEDYVLFPDEKTTSLCCWDSRNAERQKLLSLGHNGVVRTIQHSPTGPAFVSCSEDFRARFWYRKATTD